MELTCSRWQVLRTLFFCNLYISACTFGGGFVIVTFMKRKYVEQLHWLEEAEMLDITALAQSAPGAIAVNASILVGWRMAGFWGMAVSVLGTILPPMLILSGISLCYTAFAENRYVAGLLRGMQAGVAAVICDVVCSLGGTVIAGRSALQIGIMAGTFFAAWVLEIHVVLIILAAALVGLCRALRQRRREAAE